MTIGYYVYLACISGYYCKLDWQSWADRLILKSVNIEDWIYNISLAKNENELCIAVNEKKIGESYCGENKQPLEDAIVGYYYLLYLENRISMYDLLSKLSDEDDISNSSSIHEFQNFYDLWNLVKLNKDLITKKYFVENIHELLEPYRIIASDQLRHINNYSVI